MKMAANASVVDKGLWWNYKVVLNSRATIIPPYPWVLRISDTACVPACIQVLRSMLAYGVLSFSDQYAYTYLVCTLAVVEI